MRPITGEGLVIFKNSVKFLREVGKEMKRVTWPTPKELFKYTRTVLVTLIFITIFFALVDSGISYLVETFLA
ncbi:preprotein translocase subunit SecE [Salicibibacter kimchii]|uniref:Protein translocase subunit SecE n=1 Tax=Salicibibacter kimchii TaxID=2099786 RepID=A0A345C0A7_9BACI|nr:preprotein translocase subunit SecE [Salicibibacter kimchii]AXF56638.1 preprotein translocase subunit SecE [Salicibibacter kimchii]